MVWEQSSLKYITHLCCRNEANSLTKSYYRLVWWLIMHKSSEIARSDLVPQGKANLSSLVFLVLLNKKRMSVTPCTLCTDYLSQYPLTDLSCYWVPRNEQGLHMKFSISHFWISNCEIPILRVKGDWGLWNWGSHPIKCCFFQLCTFYYHLCMDIGQRPNKIIALGFLCFFYSCLLWKSWAAWNSFSIAHDIALRKAVFHEIPFNH